MPFNIHDILLVILCILLPPLAVWDVTGYGDDFIISILLTILGTVFIVMSRTVNG
jgi:uncharacterized membrane protein YqaE (UPF0057 family)